MIAPLSPSTSSLLKPLAESAVLIPNEQVYYAERQHWASIVQPLYETFIFLLAVIFLAEGQINGFDDGIGLVGTILLAAAAHAGYLAVTGGRAPSSRLAVDPFSAASRSKGLNPILRWAVGIGLLLLVSQSDPRRFGILAVFLVMARLTVVLARWTFYERRYLTNRRLIESSGFLGSRISSMPLSRVTDIVYGRTVPGEIFGYARMRVETAGQDQALGVVRFIAEPDHFYAVLVNFSAPQATAAAPPA